MNLTQYNQFIEDLRQKLDQDPRVLGLVAVGSMAQQDYQPDEWSDHDFFVITINGVQEDMRQDLSWLPQSDSLIFQFRETEHGLKVLYPEGHLLEFAVFTEAELSAIKVNRYRVLLDKTEISQKMSELAVQTRENVAHSRKAPEQRFAEMLMNLFVGVGRHARGEALSGRQFIKTYALTHLLHLLTEFTEAENHPLLDNLDPFRRFERVYPALGAELNQILEKDSLTAAAGLLGLAERALRPFIHPFPSAAVTEVQQLIKKAHLAEGEKHL